jgi:hypothetical protein
VRFGDHRGHRVSGDPVTTALPGGVVTGLGALDGVDPQVAARITLDEAVDLPHVPELPLRGPWAEPAGRLAAVLVDLPVELAVGRWRMASGGGRDLSRARGLLARDLDAVEEQWAGFEGPAKLQLLGPLSAAAMVELRNGDAAVSDQGALRDLGASLAEGVVEHVGELSRRVPGADWIVQVDEPAAALVTAGRLSRPSGWGVFPALASAEASALLSHVVEVVRGTGAAIVVHCCDAHPDWELLTGSGADGLSVPLPPSGTDQGEWADRLEQWWGSGRGLWVSVAHAGDQDPSRSRLRQLKSVLGAEDEELRRRLVLTPSCGWDPERRAGGTGGAVPVGARAYAEVRTLARELDGA